MQTVQSRVVVLPTAMENRLGVMANRISKFQLFAALAGNTSKINGQWASGNIIDVNGHLCYLQSVAREDGGGSSFNLIVSYGGKAYKTYCRTTD
jgi:hypothetical protein